ncbi:DUF4158 domain-containing protein [Streptomyces sp. NPDC002513]
MRQQWSPRLDFCLMLKFFEIEARFPEFIEEFPPPAVEYVAGLVKVPAAELTKYDLAGAKRHRKQIREALGFRPATLEDEEQLTAWLAMEVGPVELVVDRQREALLVECRARSIEPPGRTRIEKVLVAARNRWERAFCARAIERLSEVGVARLLALLKRDPGAVGLDSLLTEVNKLNDVRRLGLPEGLLADCSEKLVAAWRARAIKMYPSRAGGGAMSVTEDAAAALETAMDRLLADEPIRSDGSLTVASLAREAGGEPRNRLPGRRGRRTVPAEGRGADQRSGCPSNVARADPRAAGRTARSQAGSPRGDPEPSPVGGHPCSAGPGAGPRQPCPARDTFTERSRDRHRASAFQ